jgi:tetratricopeptide (TPR) repeat protein/tRNA A-37 threonylcarbamoyl transferase component Bud32
MNLRLATTWAAESLSGSTGQHELAQILDEYLRGLEEGSPITPEELLARHPEMADQLRGYLKGLALFHRAANPDATVAELKLRAGQAARGDIGDFRLIREIGRGGMGVVYESEQVSLGRRVALKVLPFAAAIDEKQITRFKNEAQAAAQVDHPNIVPVYAVGQDDGIHYFAMQLIGGKSLAERIIELRAQAESIGAVSAETKSTLRTKAALDHVQWVARNGVQAANALHAAHEIGVVHRDVKPSNLLLDEKGKVWITDFGVARCKSGVELTETGKLIGTMRYMSPEQTMGQPALVDHRTDVYSLGVTLYELAALRHPFEGVSDAMLATELGRTGWRRPSHWNASIPADLENIILKAMSDSRDDRYATARDMEKDLQRFVEGKPTLARRPTLAARVNKWTWRHRRSVAVAMGILVMVVSGLLVSLFVISGERAAKEMAYRDAKARLTQARKLLDEFGSSVAQGLENVPGAEGLRKQLLHKMLPYFEEFASATKEGLQEDPSLQADLALTYNKIGYLSDQLGLLEPSEAAYRKAQKILEKLAGAQLTGDEYAVELARCCNNLGQVLQKSGNLTAAREQLERALTMQQRLVEASPKALEHRADLATTSSNLGLLLSKTGDRERAELLWRAAIEMQEAIKSDAPADRANRHHLGASYNNLGSFYLYSQPELAQEWFEKAIRLQIQLVKDFPIQREYQLDLALSFNNLGAVLASMSKWDEAEQRHNDAIAIQERLVQTAPLVSVYRRDLSVSFNNLGMVQARAKRHEEAERSFQAALNYQSDLVAAHRTDVNFLSSLAGIYNNLGMVHQTLRKWPEAAKEFEQAIEFQKQAHDRAPDALYIRESLSKHYYNYAQLLRSTDRAAEAAEAIVLRRGLWPHDAKRLVSIAEELAAVCQQLPSGSIRQKYVTETAATLQAAVDAGLQQPPDLRRKPFDVLAETPSATALNDGGSRDNKDDGAKRASDNQ